MWKKTPPKQQQSTTRERLLTILFWKISDHKIYGKVNKDTANHQTLKHGNEPKTLTDTYYLLKNYKVPRKMERIIGNEGVDFSQTGDKSEMNTSKMNCYNN